MTAPRVGTVDQTGERLGVECATYRDPCRKCCARGDECGGADCIAAEEDRLIDLGDGFVMYDEPRDADRDDPAEVR